MMTVLNLPIQLIVHLLAALEQVCLHLAQPSRRSITLSTVADLTRSKAELVAKNSLLRQRLIILHRQIEKPRFIPSDRLWFDILASRVQNRKDILLRLHHQGFRLS